MHFQLYHKVFWKPCHMDISAKYMGMRKVPLIQDFRRYRAWDLKASALASAVTEAIASPK